jgi:hypothetical protein
MRLSIGCELSEAGVADGEAGTSIRGESPPLRTRTYIAVRDLHFRSPCEMDGLFQVTGSI